VLAPAIAKARAVSMPMPEEPPVTIACLPVRSMLWTTSSAVELKPNGVLIRSIIKAFFDDNRALSDDTQTYARRNDHSTHYCPLR